MSCCFRVYRSQGQFTDVPARDVSVPQLQWREPAYAFLVCCDRNFLFPVSLEPYSSPGMLSDGGRRCGPSLDFADVSSFPLVWRTCVALRSERATDYWPGHCCFRFRTVRSAF